MAGRRARRGGGGGRAAARDGRGATEAAGVPGDGALHQAVDAWGRRFAEEREAPGGAHPPRGDRAAEEAWLATLRHRAAHAAPTRSWASPSCWRRRSTGPLTDAQRGDVDTIGNAGGHLRSLVEDVFDLSAMTTGTFR
ncbi:MAG: hypothetical protein IPF99_26905 [Deltaproteobacteria bacterium]|nr:hypothetical protein [Deltaproteobacteria bacterium]